MKHPTRRALLTLAVRNIIAEHSTEIFAIPWHGPRGGRNAMKIPGWEHSPHPEISRACRKHGVALPWWSGHCSTPSTGIPECILKDVQAAYDAVYSADGGAV
jgi:hypothetical protein